jgi:hypothetical protein
LAQKIKAGHPLSRVPRFISLRGFRFEAWIGSAHLLQWNFLPAGWRAEISAAPNLLRPSIRASADEVKKKTFAEVSSRDNFFFPS